MLLFCVEQLLILKIELKVNDFGNINKDSILWLQFSNRIRQVSLPNYCVLKFPNIFVLENYVAHMLRILKWHEMQLQLIINVLPQLYFFFYAEKCGNYFLFFLLLLL